MYRSYSYNSMPQPINTHCEETVKERPHCSDSKSPEPHNELLKNTEQKGSNLPFGLEKDDLILIIIIAILIFNDCNDTLLLLALAYIFFADNFNL